MKTSSKPFQFKKKYLLWGLLLICAEVVIALYAKDKIIRPYGGDFLVVILLYCIVRSFTPLSVKKACQTVLLFSYVIEILQYFNLADKLGFRRGSIPYILMGNYFSWVDIVSYTLGTGTVLIVEMLTGAHRSLLIKRAGD